MITPALPPSQERRAYWLLHGNPATSFSSTMQTGKWLIVVSSSVVDQAWEHIKTALTQGLLPCMAKVSTRHPSPHGAPDAHVICVYTNDCYDQVDVFQVRRTLHNLGFTQPLEYKPDYATMRGDYSPAAIMYRA